MQASYKVIIYYGSCKLGICLDTRYPILNVTIQTFKLKKRTHKSITTSVIHTYIFVYLQMRFLKEFSSNLSKKTPSLSQG